MSKKILISLSLVFLLLCSLFVIDFSSYYISYQEILNLNTSIKYKISKTGIIDETFKTYYLNNYNIDIKSNKSRYEVGETCEYYVIKNLDMIYKNISPKKIELKSEVVVGIFNY